MKYTLWYSCYIDLFREMGVAACFIEHEKKLRMFWNFCNPATINKLNLIAVIIGLKTIPAGADVDIIGNSKYISETLKRIKTWIEKDELDIKSHTDLLRNLWPLMTSKGRMTTQFYSSRRSDPMLWSGSKAAGEFFREIQEKLADSESKFPHPKDIFEVSSQWDVDYFTSYKFRSPLTDLAWEKLFQQNREKMAKKKASEVQQLDNVIPFKKGS
jgi:ribonuclease HI